ncbi:MAG: hypothetical protein COZ85_02705 [Candidatus Moranbacteria bacterium CG_4_8_14_3_um_filter_34_16]|nr:MAG: hypothetical protein COT31_03750 [Candidatus Moranbacteria bacterium CG08_land_8_20_14_0_20_34_16]PIW94880.1 MAG: hypothetical protein COZ85_02705 [Candidatus Moranbacteria bacterium CG_4_8_14_3_um_filter_34_16]PJA89412.1 MAG: hypothetical protein CO138_00560 [Candidatus Moranbacteria bacterium CG_4_9_14_3_um_filter_33_15]
MLKYLVPFLEAFFFSVFFLFATISFSHRFFLEKHKSSRHIHLKRGKNIPRIGGIAMVLAFNLAIIFDKNLVISPELYGFMLGTGIIFAVGFWDDIKEIFWKVQLFFQVAVAVLVFIMGVRVYYITNPFTGGIIRFDSSLGTIFSVLMVIFWIVVVINAINWADGIDGLSGGISLIAGTTIFFLSLRPEVNQPPIAIVCAILTGVFLGFLIFNFYPAKIMAGTCGAMFMGFSLSVLAIFSGTKIATALLVLIIPLVDFLWVIGERFRNKRSLFQPDMNHLHYKLMELGWSQRKIVFSYWIFTVIVAFVALNTRIFGKSVTLFLTVFLAVIFLIYINKKILCLKNKRTEKY